MDEKIRFGFLLYLLKQLEQLEPKRYYGLIVVQKIVYFLKEAFDVKLPYEFYFYHFGPYSDTLDWDLRMMKIFHLIDISSDPVGSGYSIEVNKEKVQESQRLAQRFIKANKPNIDTVLEIFGDYAPSGLELASTIHFVYKNNKSKQPKAQLRRIVVEKVKRLKPKFTVSQIKEQYDYLTEKNIIT